MQQQQQHTGGDGGDGLRPHNRVRQKSVEECGEATGLNGTRANVCESKALAHTQRERERERSTDRIPQTNCRLAPPFYTNPLPILRLFSIFIQSLTTGKKRRPHLEDPKRLSRLLF
jgi:hypothetical protein